MSDSTTSVRKRRDKEITVPRAVVHKKILDVAETQPDASMETIAEEVSGASLSIVERVLEEYGDPATSAAEHADQSESSGEDDAEVASSTTDSDTEPPDVVETATDEDIADEKMDDETKWAVKKEVDDGLEVSKGGTEEKAKSEDTGGKESDADEGESSKGNHEGQAALSVKPSDITEKQLETLREIYKRPHATQAELGDALGVTGATINQRVNTIKGFDWSRRQQFVETLFENEAPAETDTPVGAVTSDQDRGLDPAPQTGSNGSTDSTGDMFTTIAPMGLSSVNQCTRKGSIQPQPDGGESSADSANLHQDKTERQMATETTQTTSESLEDLIDQVESLTQEFEVLKDEVVAQPSSGAGSHTDPDLTYKILRACITTDDISEEEELEIVKLMMDDRPSSE